MAQYQAILEWGAILLLLVGSLLVMEKFREWRKNLQWDKIMTPERRTP